MLLGSLTLLAALLPQGDATAGLKSKDAQVRVEALRALVAEPSEGAEKAFANALRDADWEAVALGARGLGELRSDHGFDDLVELALEGPVRAVRHAAAAALGRIDAVRGFDAVARKLGGELAPQACEAILALAPEVDGKVELDFLEHAGKSKDARTRRLAAAAIVAVAGEERAERLRGFLGAEDLVLRASALEGAEVAADPRVAPALLEVLAVPALSDVLERRAARALDAAARGPGDAAPVTSALASAVAAAKDDSVRAALARTIGVLAEERESKRGVEPGPALELLSSLASGSGTVRAAVAAAEGRVRTEGARARLATRVEKDADGHVRLVALLALERDRDAAGPEIERLSLALVAKDEDPAVREEAAVALGVRGLASAVEPLQAALADADWRVAVAAAVSLGRTRVPAVAPALEALAKNADWKLRGGAVVGLTRLGRREGVPALLAALEDPEPCVRRTAWEFWKAVSAQEYPCERAPWAAWWEKNSGREELSLPEDVRERRKQMEYAVDPTEVYAGLDLVVLQSRGDHLESVLQFQGLAHRITRSSKLVDDALHPECVFVSNCTGEITAPEVERVAWFVHAGGSLFGSCWALQETIAAACPGFVRRYETGEVLDDVPAYPCDPASPWLEGVFPADVRPVYHLEGAFLIEVVDRERVEVLIDSPECAAAWGNGDLAAWFRVGHGVVLDSANHFDLQGFESAHGLKKPEERQAYAVDHMGLSLADLRKIRDDKLWAKSQTASERVRDLSVFRLVTNFVRYRRLRDL